MASRRGLHHHGRKDRGGSGSIDLERTLTSTAPTSSIPAPPSLPACLVGMGLTTDSDVAGFFDSDGDVATFAAEKGWNEQEVAEVLSAWRLARHRTRRAVAQAVPVFHTSASTPSSLTPSIARSSCTSSRAVAGGGIFPNPVAAPCSADMLGPVEVHTGEVREANRRATNLGDLRQLWFSMGPRGLLWRDGTAAQHELRWAFLRRKGAALTAGTTRKHMLTWTAWVSWMAEHYPAEDIYSPLDLHFALFLDSEKEKGGYSGQVSARVLPMASPQTGRPVPSPRGGGG